MGNPTDYCGNIWSDNKIDLAIQRFQQPRINLKHNDLQMFFVPPQFLLKSGSWDTNKYLSPNFQTYSNRISL